MSMKRQEVNPRQICIILLVYPVITERTKNYGALDWVVVANVICQIIEIAMSIVSVTDKWLCPLSILSNGHVTCRYNF